MSEAFPDIPKIQFEGPQSKNPLSFKHYNADEVVGGKTMKDHLRFGVAYWHTLRNTGADPFGIGTAQRPWDDGTDSISNAQNRARVCFEFMEKLGVDYYCFHDRDVAPEGRNLTESNANLDAVADVLEAEQQRTGKKLLWGTACLFVHPRYCQGAATSPNAGVFAYAAAQVKKALEVTHRLGGEGYTFWGGREGYATLWNTNMKREVDHLARLLHMAVDYKKQIGYKGPFYIEPKPREPSTHQYDSDAAACETRFETAPNAGGVSLQKPLPRAGEDDAGFGARGHVLLQAPGNRQRDLDGGGAAAHDHDVSRPVPRSDHGFGPALLLR
jgi:xylose isomerase